MATALLPFSIVGGGYVHLGDTVIYLAAALLLTPYAMAAAGIGASAADLLVAPIWAPFTIAIKAIMACAFTAKKERLLCGHNAIAIVLAGLVCVVGYYGAEIAILCADMPLKLAATTALASVPFKTAPRRWPAASALWCWRWRWIS